MGSPPVSKFGGTYRDRWFATDRGSAASQRAWQLTEDSARLRRAPGANARPGDAISSGDESGDAREPRCGARPDSTVAPCDDWVKDEGHADPGPRSWDKTAAVGPEY